MRIPDKFRFFPSMVDMFSNFEHTNSLKYLPFFSSLWFNEIETKLSNPYNLIWNLVKQKWCRFRELWLHSTNVVIRLNCQESESLRNGLNGFFEQFLSILAIVCLVGKVSPSSDLSTATSSTNQSDFVFGNTGTFASTLIPAQVLVPYSQVPNKHLEILDIWWIWDRFLFPIVLLIKN